LVITRRAALRAMAALGAVAAPRVAGARDYASASEVLDTIDGLAAEVEGALDAIVRKVPGAAAFATSLRADHARERAGRAAVRSRLRLPSAAASKSRADSASLDGLRSLQQDLVHAHAEGLPALDDERAVQVLAGHMVEAARRLTVIDLWIELEGQRAG
jgi:hypothetical protein